MNAMTNAFCRDGDDFIQCLLSRDVQALTACIEAGIAVDHRRGFASTPLHCAARCGFAEMVEVLLAHHANLHRTDNLGRTPLHAAAAGGHVPVIELLVAAGADVNAQDSMFQMTPLHLAVRHGHAEALFYLLWYGADREIRDSFGDSAMTLAYRLGLREVLVNLKNPLPIRMVSRRKNTRPTS